MTLSVLDVKAEAGVYGDDIEAIARKSAEVWQLSADDDPLLVWGRLKYDLFNVTGYVWMQLLREPTRRELRALKKAQGLWFNRYHYLTARVASDENKARAVRFLEFLGFEKAPRLMGDNTYHWRRPT